MASLPQLPAKLGLLGLRQSTGFGQLEVRERPPSSAAAKQCGQLALPAAPGRLLTPSSRGVVATLSKESSSTPSSQGLKLNPKPLLQFQLKDGGSLGFLSQSQLKDGGSLGFLRQFIRNCEGLGLRQMESSDESVQDGRLCRRTAMAAAFFVALGLVVQHEEAVSAEAMAAAGFALPVGFPWEKADVQQLEPAKGTCATCIGVVDETLGACSAAANCVSSFDDRPRFFVAPWEFPGKLPFALDKLREVLLSSGAQIKEQGERYVHAVFTSKEGVMDDVEFLFSNPREDAIVVVRSASRAVNLDDNERNRKRLEEIRKSLTWEQVPVLRNRKRFFFFLESPWDTFGPEPPPSFNYKDGLDFVPE